MESIHPVSHNDRTHWTCLSGLKDAEVVVDFALDRRGHLQAHWSAVWVHLQRNTAAPPPGTTEVLIFEFGGITRQWRFAQQ